MWRTFSSRFRATIYNGLRQAGECGASSMLPEHLLWAITHDEQCGGSKLMQLAGVDPTIVREKVEILSPRAARVRTINLDPSLMVIFESAERLAKRNHQHPVGTDHLIATLADYPEIPSGKILVELGLTSRKAGELLPEVRAQRPLPEMPSRIPKFITGMLRLPLIPWRIYVRKSLGHRRFGIDPYPLYRQIRQRDPVRRDPLAPVWTLMRYDDVAEMLKDNRYLKDPFVTEHLPRDIRKQLVARADINRPEIETTSMLFLDPPDHTRVRSAFTRAFTPRNLQELRPRIAQLTAQRIDAVRDAGEFDLISQLAYPLPAMVIAEMLGFPPEDYEKIKGWSDIFTQALSLTATSAEQALAAIARDEIREYISGIINDLQKNPRDTMVARLVANSSQPGGLNRDEIFTNSVLLLAAGHETTTNLIGNGVLALMRDRDQWDMLVKNPELIESTVEEMLRYDSPVQWTSRLAAQEMNIRGRKIPEGSIVLGCVGAANRDPERFPDPERFDIQRRDNKHLSFGTGVHFCLGAALARMEAQIALAGLIERFPKMNLTNHKLRWMKGLTFRGVLELRLVTK